MSLDIKVSIGFSIINLTEFEWKELQEHAQYVASKYAYHCIPTAFSLSNMVQVHHQDSSLSVFIRRCDNALEFLFIQNSLFPVVEDDMDYKP